MIPLSSSNHRAPTIKLTACERHVLQRKNKRHSDSYDIRQVLFLHITQPYSPRPRHRSAWMSRGSLASFSSSSVYFLTAVSSWLMSRCVRISMRNMASLQYFSYSSTFSSTLCCERWKLAWILLSAAFSSFSRVWMMFARSSSLRHIQPYKRGQSISIGSRNI